METFSYSKLHLKMVEIGTLLKDHWEEKNYTPVIWRVHNCPMWERESNIQISRTLPIVMGSNVKMNFENKQIKKM
jgi:hypothetical protein